MAKKNGKLTSSSEGHSYNNHFIIDDESFNDPRVRDQVMCPVVNHEVKGHGLVPRDYKIHPAEMFQPVTDLKLFDPSEYDAHIDEQEKSQSSLEHLCDWESLDQDGQGYCLDAGTMVLLADGSEKPIEEFVGGEEVVTHLNRTRKVVRPTVRKFSGDLFTVGAIGQDVRTVTATGCHRFLSGTGEWQRLDSVVRSGSVVFNGVQRRLGDYYPVVRSVQDYTVHCLEVEEDHSFVANGYSVHNCWFYSTTGCVMALRSIMHLPKVRLSAHAGAWKIKGGRDEGGWCGLSAKFHKEVGCPSVQFWAEKSMSRQYDKPETWANAALHKVTEDWQDITRDIYDQNFSLRQLDTCLLCNIPCATDFNWWGHSVMMGRLVKIENGSYGRRIRNSWSQSWGEKGWATLRGSKANPDSAIALRVTKASAA